MFDSELTSLTALVIDDSEMARSVIAGMLRDAGLRSVSVARDPRHARRLLEQGPFDVILCDYHYAGCDESGQDLLDALRRERALPFRTIFFMVTGEARYERVAAVVEHAPDDYLLKPLNTEMLLDRLAASRRRKIALASLYEHLEQGRQEEALAVGESLIAGGSRYRLSAARICAELCLMRNDHARANALFALALQERPLPWARLGMAQIAYARNDRREARRALESLISEHEHYADAYDLLARIQIEGADLAAALQTARLAAQATPANVARQQRLGALAFLLGDARTAEAALEKASRVGMNTRAFDLQSIVTLSLLRLDRGAGGRDIERLGGPLEQALARHPDSFRLRALAASARACVLLARRRSAQAEEQVHLIARCVREPGFDFEMACNLLALLVRRDRLRGEAGGATDDRQSPADGPEALSAAVRALALRFCVSRTATDLLRACARDHAGYAEALEQAHATITRCADEAMSWVMEDAVGRAARSLLETGRETLNARLLGLAASLAVRYPERITAATRSAIAEAESLRRSHCSYGTHAALSGMAAPPTRIRAEAAVREPGQTTGGGDQEHEPAAGISVSHLTA